MIFVSDSCFDILHHFFFKSGAIKPLSMFSNRKRIKYIFIMFEKPYSLHERFRCLFCKKHPCWCFWLFLFHFGSGFRVRINSTYGFQHTSLSKRQSQVFRMPEPREGRSQNLLLRENQRLATPVILPQGFTGLPTDTFYMLFGHLPDLPFFLSPPIITSGKPNFSNASTAISILLYGAKADTIR